MSAQFRTLRREVEKLRRQFLPDPFDPLGQYADGDQVQAMTRAYLLLAHAEIESFLEGWALAIAKAAEKVWNKDKRIARPMSFLIATGDRGVSIPDPDASGAAIRLVEAGMSDLVASMMPRYYKFVRDNNGVKAKNTLSMFSRLGVPDAAFGGVLLPQLTSLGSRRGDHAHASITAVTLVLDPLDEHGRIQALVSELEQFDKALSSYKGSIR